MEEGRERGWEEDMRANDGGKMIEGDREKGIISSLC